MVVAKCQDCDGAGEVRDDDDQWIQCLACGGTGEIDDGQEEEPDTDPHGR